MPLISEPYSFLQTFVYICVFASVAALVLVAVYFAVRKYREVQPALLSDFFLFRGGNFRLKRGVLEGCQKAKS